MVWAYIKRVDILNALDEAMKAADHDYRYGCSFGERCSALILREAIDYMRGYIFNLDFEFYNTSERIGTDER